MLNAQNAMHLDRKSGGPPILRVDGVADTVRWAADNRDALRSLVIHRVPRWFEVSDCGARPRSALSSDSWRRPA